MKYLTGEEIKEKDLVKVSPPTAMGEYLGIVKSIDNDSIIVKTQMMGNWISISCTIPSLQFKCREDNYELVEQ